MQELKNASLLTHVCILFPFHASPQSIQTEPDRVHSVLIYEYIWCITTV